MDMDQHGLRAWCQEKFAVLVHDVTNCGQKTPLLKHEIRRSLFLWSCEIYEKRTIEGYEIGLPSASSPR